MPLLIFHCRTRLFLAIIQQGTIPGGARTRTQVLAVAGTVNVFHISFPPNFGIEMMIVKISKKTTIFFRF